MPPIPARKVTEYHTRCKPTWCPGCGDWGIWASLKTAMAELKLDPDKTVIVYGIGCSGNMANTIRTYGFHGLHGRALPAAEAIKIANHALTVIVVAGDGDGYGEGLNHFIQSMRGNHDLTYIVHDNQVYGLTTGQASPTAHQGFAAKSTPHGVLEEPINPLTLAVSAGCGFVSRGFAGDLPHTSQLIKLGIQHKGFSLVDILQPCTTFNKINTVEWYREHIRKLPEDADRSNRLNAWKLASDLDRLAVGVLYEENKPSYTDRLPQLEPGPLVSQSLTRKNLTSLYKEFE